MTTTKPASLASTSRPPIVAIVVAVILGILPRCAVSEPVAAPLADRIPADALLYVGWVGSERASQLAEGSHAQALLAASNIVEAFEVMAPQAGRVAATKNPDLRAAMQFFTEVYPILVRHPTAVAFGGVEWDSGPEPLPKILLICDAGADAPLLRNKLIEWFVEIKKMELVTLLDERDGLLYMSLGWPKLDLAMIGGDPTRSLAASERFNGPMQGLSSEPMKVGFVDLGGIVSLAREGMRREDKQDQLEKFEQFLDATGLHALGSLAVTTGFVDRLYRTDAFVELRGERMGLAALLENEPIDASLLEMIPADAGFVAAGRLDLSKLLEAARNAVLVTNPDGVGDFEQGLAFLDLLMGTDVEEDLFAAAGETWAAYVAPGAGGSALSVVAINKPDDAIKMRAAMVNLSLSLVTLVNQGLRQNDKPFRVEGRQFDWDGMKIYSLDLPAVAPSWGGSDKAIFFGLYPQSVASAAALAGGQGGFAQSEAFAAVKRLAGENPIRGFSYVDLPLYSGRSYSILNANLQLGSGLLAGFGETQNLRFRAPGMILPPFHVFQEHMTPAVSVTFVDDRGLHLRSQEPFPLSGLLGLGMQ